jgi:hypothetical protein
VSTTKRLLAPAAGFALLFVFTFQAQGQDHLMAPDDVKTGLRILNQVVGHTGRLIASKNYDTVPREHHEIVEGAEILREALAHEPDDLQTEVDAMLDDVVAASSALEEPSEMHDDAALATAHEALADAVHEVIDVFPEELRPTPRY